MSSLSAEDRRVLASLGFQFVFGYVGNGLGNWLIYKHGLPSPPEKTTPF